jgi:hypothetical protein
MLQLSTKLKWNKRLSTRFPGVGRAQLTKEQLRQFLLDQLLEARDVTPELSDDESAAGADSELVGSDGLSSVSLSCDTEDDESETADVDSDSVEVDKPIPSWSELLTAIEARHLHIQPRPQTMRKLQGASIALLWSTGWYIGTVAAPARPTKATERNYWIRYEGFSRLYAHFLTTESCIDQCTLPDRQEPPVGSYVLLN